jgi:hypothetical protein
MAKGFKTSLKFGFVGSLLLGFIWLVAAIYCMVNQNSSLGLKSLLVSGVWFTLAYVLKKVHGQNTSYKKVSEVCAYIFSKAQDKDALTPLRLVQIMYLSDYAAAITLQKSLFPEAKWRYESYLMNDIAQYWANKSKIFLNLTTKGLDPIMMVPPRTCSAAELAIVTQVISSVEGKTPFEMQQLVNDTLPMKLKPQGEWDLVSLVTEPADEPGA